MALENPMFSFFAFALEIFLVLLLYNLTERKITYGSIATNGIIVTMASAILLFDQRPIGFLLLAYASFLMTASVKEYVETKYNKEDLLGKLLKLLGHHYFVSFILIVIFAYEYIYKQFSAF